MSAISKCDYYIMCEIIGLLFYSVMFSNGSAILKGLTLYGSGNDVVLQASTYCIYIYV